MKINNRLIRETRRSVLLLAAVVLCGFLGAILVIAQARLLSRVIASVHLAGWGWAEAMDSLTLFLAVLGGRMVCTWLGEGLSGRAAIKIKNELRSELLAKLCKVGPAWMSGQRSGEITATLTQGLDALDAYFSQFLPQAVLAALVPLIVLFAVFPLDWLSGLVLLVTAPLLPVFMILIGGAAENLTRKQWGALSKMSAHFLEILQGLATLKALGRVESAAEKLEKVNDQYRRTTLSVLRLTFVSSLVLELVATVSVALVAVQIGLRLLAGRLGFEEALFILVLAPDFYLPLRQLGMKFHSAMNGVSAARRIYEIMDLADRQVGNEMVTDQGLEPPVNPPELEFQQVSFRYSDRDMDALKEISLLLPSGKMTALVGKTGAGKSSMAGLLLGFLKPTAGTLLVDGRNLETLDLDLWRSRIAWVGQKPAIFSGSIADNLRLGARTAEEDEMKQALIYCGLEEWISNLAEGLQTQVGEGGIRLSSGQLQRLALARALLRKPQLVVLDEPTAHLDVVTEKDLLPAIDTLCSGCTALLIAHRLPTVQLAHQVVVLDAGRIVEQGEPGRLLYQGGKFTGLAQIYGGSR